jgi:hypothetical protein
MDWQSAKADRRRDLFDGLTLALLQLDIFDSYRKSGIGAVLDLPPPVGLEMIWSERPNAPVALSDQTSRVFQDYFLAIRAIGLGFSPPPSKLE